MNFIYAIRQLFYPSPIPKEWLEVGSDISSLAETILTPDEMDEVNELSLAITSGGKRKEQAIAYLWNFWFTKIIHIYPPLSVIY